MEWWAQEGLRLGREGEVSFQGRGTRKTDAGTGSHLKCSLAAAAQHRVPAAFLSRPAGAVTAGPLIRFLVTTASGYAFEQPPHWEPEPSCPPGKKQTNKPKTHFTVLFPSPSLCSPGRPRPPPKYTPPSKAFLGVHSPRLQSTGPQRHEHPAPHTYLRSRYQ